MKKSLFMLLPVLLLVSAGVALAADPIPLPTNPPHSQPAYVYHYDPVAPTVDWVIPAGIGPAGKVGGPFTDFLTSSSPWHWETEWFNPGAGQIVLPIIFRGPNASFPVAGRLTLIANARVIVEFVFDERPEVGTWTYSMTPGINNPLFEHDCGVCEGTTHTVSMPPEWQDAPYDEINGAPHVEAVFNAPVPATTNWGLIVLLVSLAGVAAIFILRRRAGALA